MTDSEGNTPAPPAPGNPAPPGNPPTLIGLGNPLSFPGKLLTLFSCKVEANKEWPLSKNENGMDFSSGLRFMETTKAYH